MSHGAAPSSISGEWLAARASLAARRLRRFRGAATFMAVVVLAGAAAWQYGRRWSSAREPAAVAAMPAVDTGAWLRQRETAQRDVQAYEDSLRAFAQLDQARAPSVAGVAADSLSRVLAQLDSALERAAKSPLPTSYRALAGTKALSGRAAVRMLSDTLMLLEEVRRSLDPVEAPPREFAQLSERANAIGRALQGLGQERRAELARQVNARDARARAAVDTAAAAVARWKIARDRSANLVLTLDSMLTSAREQPAAGAQPERPAQMPPRILGASPMLAAVSLILSMLGLSFAAAIMLETRAPTIADAREAERVAGIPVLTALHHLRLASGARRPAGATGADGALRMVYLSLTAGDTRHRAVCITGDDASRTATIAARLAVSAAADERATLVVDLAPGVPSAAARLGWQNASGFAEAMAGVRLWREVTRSVGASDGLDLDVIPSGAIRGDTATAVSDGALQGEFTAFADEYDFTVLTAPSQGTRRWVAALIPNVAVLAIVRTGRTRLKTLVELVRAIHDDGLRVNGIILIDD